MPEHGQGLLAVARQLLGRGGRRGQLAAPLVSRSVSTTYYGVFHVLAEEASKRIVGRGSRLLRRRRILVRCFAHGGPRTAMTKVRGVHCDGSIEDLLRPDGTAVGPVRVLDFARGMATAFLDAQAERGDADYDLNKAMTEADARLLLLRVTRAIAEWRGATAAADNDFKQALCTLLLLKGQLRREP